MWSIESGFGQSQLRQLVTGRGSRSILCLWRRVYLGVPMIIA